MFLFSSPLLFTFSVSISRAKNNRPRQIGRIMGRFDYFGVVVYFIWVEIIDALNASCALSAERWYAGVEDVFFLDRKRRALIMRPDNEYLICGERN